jgi:hypothetical protein
VIGDGGMAVFDEPSMGQKADRLPHKTDGAAAY